MKLSLKPLQKNVPGATTDEGGASRPEGEEAGSKRDLEEKEISNPAAGAPPKKAAKKSSKSSASSTLLDKIVEAIRNEKKPGGSSRVSIKKYLVANYQITNEKALKKAFQSGLDSGRLVQNKASFEVAGEQVCAASRKPSGRSGSEGVLGRKDCG